MLAAAASSSNQVVGTDIHKTRRPKLLRHSLEDDVESAQNITGSSNQVGSDVLSDEVGTKSDYNDMANGPSSTEYCDSTCHEQPSDNSALTDEITVDDEKNGSVKYSANRSVDGVDNFNYSGFAVQSSDQCQQKNLVGDGADICFYQIDHSADCSGQTVCPVDHTDHSADQDGQALHPADHSGHSADRDGQALHLVDHTDHSADQDGQALHSADHIDHLADHDGQTLHPVDHTGHSADHDGQVLHNVDHTDHLTDHDGQTLHPFDHTGHSADHDGQVIHNVDHTDHLTDHDVQALHPVDHIVHSADRDGQALHSVDHTDQSADRDGPTLCHADSTEHPASDVGQIIRPTDLTDGQAVCNVDQVVMLTRLTAVPVTIARHCLVDQSDHSDNHCS